MKISKSLLVALLCFPLVALAQQNTISPYSSFGIGEFQSQGFALNNDLGGLGIALRSNNQLNLLNPASTSALTLTSFEVGVKGSALFLKEVDLEQEAFSSTMAYLSLGFPIAKGVGVSAGLLPYSFMGYQLSQNSTWSDGVDTLETTTDYIGSGGLSRAFLNFGAEVVDGLSVGATGNIIFGTLTQQRDLKFDDGKILNSRDENLYTVKDFSFDLGVQYQTNIKDKQLIFGATYSPQANFDERNTGGIYTYNIVNNYEYIRDTLVHIDTTIVNGLVLPMSFGAGLSLGKENKWFVSGEYEFKEWSQLSLFGTSNANLQNASEFKVGAWIIPNNKDVHKYWKSIQYRMGVNYNTGYLAARSDQNATLTNINDLSLSLGFGLPLKRSNTIANIGVQFGKRGTTENNLVEEKYIKFHLAFTFNDKWFTKRKID